MLRISCITNCFIFCFTLIFGVKPLLKNCSEFKTVKLATGNHSTALFNLLIINKKQSEEYSYFALTILQISFVINIVNPTIYLQTCWETCRLIYTVLWLVYWLSTITCQHDYLNTINIKRKKLYFWDGKLLLFAFFTLRLLSLYLLWLFAEGLTSTWWRPKSIMVEALWL